MNQKKKFLREVIFPRALTHRWCSVCRHCPTSSACITATCYGCTNQARWEVNPDSWELKRFLNDDMDILDWLKLFAESQPQPQPASIKTAIAA